MTNGNGKKNYLAEVALVVAGVAFSGMGFCLVRWGEVQAQVDRMNKVGSERLLTSEERQRQINDQLRTQLHKLDKRSERTAILVEGIASKLQVPVPPRRGEFEE